MFLAMGYQDNMGFFSPVAGIAESQLLAQGITRNHKASAFKISDETVDGVSRFEIGRPQSAHE